jgi:ribose transport system substrate-binding protein
VQQPFEFGYQSVRIMSHLAKGDKSVVPADGTLYIPHIVVTRDGKGATDGDIIKLRESVADFQKKLQTQLGK